CTSALIGYSTPTACQTNIAGSPLAKPPKEGDWSTTIIRSSPVNQHQAYSNQRHGRRKSGSQGIAQHKVTCGDAEQWRQKCESRKAACRIARDQREPDGLISHRTNCER